MSNQPQVGFGFGVEGDQSLLGTIKQLREEMKGLAQQQDGLRSSAVGLNSAFRTMIQLAGALRIAQFGREVFATAVNIGKMQQITGITAETLSVYYKAAGDVGIAHEAVDKALQKAAKSLASLRRGSSQAAAGYSVLQLTAKDFAGLNTDQAIQKISDRIGTMKDGMGKAAAAQAIFGKSGAQLIPVLNQLAGTGFEAVATQARHLGLVFTSDMAASALRAAAALHDVKGYAEGTAAQFETGLLPAVADVSDAFVGAVNGGSNGFKTLGEIAGTALKYIVTGLMFLGVEAGEISALLVEDFSFAWGEIKGGAATVFEAFKRAATGDFSGALAAMKAGVRDAGREWDDFNARRHAIEDSSDQQRRKIYEDVFHNKSSRKNVDRTGEPGDPNASAGVGKGGFDLDRAKAAEAKAAAQRELEEYRAFAHEREQSDKNEYDRGLISLQEYFERRRAAVREERALELKALGSEKTALQGVLAKVEAAPVAAGSKHDEQEAKKQAEILALKTQIAGVESQMVIATSRGRQEISKLSDDQGKAETEHQQKTLEFEEKLAELDGNKLLAAQKRNELEDQRMRTELKQLGMSDQQVDARLSAYKSARETRAAGDEAKTGFEDSYADFERRKALIQGMSRDSMPMYQMERQLAALYRDEIPVLQQKIDKLREAANAARQHKDEKGNFDQLGLADDLDKQVAELQTKVEIMSGELTKMDVSWMHWKTTAKQSIDEVSQSMTTGLNGWIEGHQRFGQAVAQTWNHMVMTGVQAAEKIAAHWIAGQLKMLLVDKATKAKMRADAAAHHAQMEAQEKKSGLKTVFTSAKVAASKAYKAHAENPILAAAMAALAFAATMAFAAFQTGGVVDKDRHAPMAFAGARSFRGAVSGPGGIDKVPAWLTHGESVLTTGATRALGADTINAFNGGDFSALRSGVFLPPLRQAPYGSSAALSRMVAGAGSTSGRSGQGDVHFNHTTHIDGLQALDGASVRAALEEHGDLIGDIAVSAVRDYMRQGGVNR